MSSATIGKCFVPMTGRIQMKEWPDLEATEAGGVVRGAVRVLVTLSSCLSFHQFYDQGFLFLCLFLRHQKRSFDHFINSASNAPPLVNGRNS